MKGINLVVDDKAEKTAAPIDLSDWGDLAEDIYYDVFGRNARKVSHSGSLEWPCKGAMQP